MRKIATLDGQRFNRLTVVRFGHTDKKHQFYECVCDCGNVVTVRSDCLKEGNTKSCGCLNREMASIKMKKAMTTHGGSGTRLHRTWKHMRERCYSFGKDLGKDYADKGVVVCDDWNDFESFKKWSLENGYSDNLSIDRIDPFGNYEPSNCRWTTTEVQGRNKRNSIYLEADGVRKHLKEWSECLGIKYHTLYQRLEKSYDPKVILRPYRHGNKII